MVSHTDNLVSQISQLLLTEHMELLIKYQILHHNDQTLTFVLKKQKINT